jgi:hypothetical protein
VVGSEVPILACSVSFFTEDDVHAGDDEALCRSNKLTSALLLAITHDLRPGATMEL